MTQVQLKNGVEKGQNPLKGEVVITLGGDSWPGKITLDATMKIETIAGMSITKIANQFSNNGDISTSNLLMILKIVADESGKIVGENTIKRAIETAGIAGAIGVVGDLIAMILMPAGTDFTDDTATATVGNARRSRKKSD